MNIAPERIREAKERADLVALVQADGIPMTKAGGGLWSLCCPFHDERTPSLYLYPDQTFHCFGCGAHGDAIHWVRTRRGLSFVEAIDLLAGGPPPTPDQVAARQDDRRKYQPILPAPSYAGPFRARASRKHGEVVSVNEYRNAQGQLLIVDVRYERIEGDERKKAVITWCWARDEEGTEQWQATRPSHSVPLYGLDALARREDTPVILCEGARKADYCQRHLPQAVAMGWCGGADMVAGVPPKVDLTPLRGRPVWMWPDADWQGVNAAGWLRHHLGDDFKGLIDIGSHGDGWDAANATADEALAGWANRREDPDQALRQLLAVHPRPIKNGKALGRPCPLLAGVGSTSAADPAPAPDESAEPTPAAVSPRNAWLARAKPKLEALISALNLPTPGSIPADLSVLTFARKGRSESVMGTCLIERGIPTRIWISPTITDPCDVLQTLLHELIHAALPRAKHGKQFQEVASALGFSPPFSQHMPPTEGLAAQLKAIAAELGDYPPRPPADTAAIDEDANDDSDERGDIANASQFIADHGRDLRFVPDHQSWYLWDGRCWHRDLEGRVLTLAEATMRGLAREHLARAKRLRAAAQAAEEDRRDGLLKAARTSEAKAEQVQSLKKMKDLLTLAQARAEVVLRPEQLDPDEHLICCLSGMIDLRNGRCYAHDRKYLATRCAPTTYDEKGLGKRDATLDRVVRHVCNGDDQVLQFAQLSLGRSLFGNNDLEKIYIWWGDGGSGKGTLFEGIKSTLGGEYCMTAEFQSFVKTQGYRVRDDLERLQRANLVLAAEAEQGEHLAAAVLKAISGGDTITARKLYGVHSEFRPRMSLHLQCNDRPQVSDLDGGMWRRLVLVPCGPTVPESERDPGVKRHLQSDAGRAAILAWLVAGAVASHGLRSIPLPPAIQAAVNAYRSESDTSKDFIAECLLLSAPENRDRTWAACRDVIDAYHHWADDMHLDKRYRASDKALCKRLEARGCWRAARKVDGKQTKIWWGLTLPLTAEKNVANSSSYRPSEDEHADQMRPQSETEKPETGTLVKSHTCAHEKTAEGEIIKKSSREDFTRPPVSGFPVSLSPSPSLNQKKENKINEEPSDTNGTDPAVF
jgi:P4 family phage/plasmid primase-like protien